MKPSETGVDLVHIDVDDDVGYDAPPIRNKRPDAARIISLGGGKGGVGRSVIAANLGVFLSVIGKRVVILDADFGCSNLHTILGMPFPNKTIDDVIMRKRESLDDVIMPSSMPGLGLISGTGDSLGVSDPRAAQRNRFLKLVTELNVDYVILDLKAGTSKTSLDLFLMADFPIVVCVPEPTAMENAYRFIKAAFFRRLWHNDSFKSLRGLLTDAQRASKELGILSPPQFLDSVRRRFPDLADSLDHELVLFRPKLVVNYARNRSDLMLGEAISRAVQRKMNIVMDCPGCVEFDDAVSLSVRKRRPVLLEYPDVKPSKNIEQIARKIISTEAAATQSRNSLKVFKTAKEQTHYELLGVDFGAEDEEIRAAYKQVKKIYAHDSVVVYGLFTYEELEALHTRFDEAYGVVVDPSKRHDYDLTLHPIGKAKKGEEAGGQSETMREGGSGVGAVQDSKKSAGETEEITTLPPGLEIDDNTVFSGDLLRQIREHRKIDLRDISAKTKISHMTLKAIEEMCYDEIPAPVYVRGFLLELAKYLKIPPAQVARSYISQYRLYLDAKAGDD